MEQLALCSGGRGKCPGRYVSGFPGLSHHGTHDVFKHCLFVSPGTPGTERVDALKRCVASLHVEERSALITESLSEKALLDGRDVVYSILRGR